jgi:hypothetical protein
MLVCNTQTNEKARFGGAFSEQRRQERKEERLIADERENTAYFDLP